MRLNNDPIRHQDVTAAVLEFSSSTLSLSLSSNPSVSYWNSCPTFLAPSTTAFFLCKLPLPLPPPPPSASQPLHSFLCSLTFSSFFLPYSSPLPLVLMYPCHFLLALFFLTLSSHLLLYLRCFHSKKKGEKEEERVAAEFL